MEWNPGELAARGPLPTANGESVRVWLGKLRYARVGSHGRMSASYKRTAPRVDGDDPDNTPRRNRCVHIGYGTSAEYEKSEKSKAEGTALKNLGTRLSGNATGPVVHTWRNKSWNLNVRAVGTP